MTGETPTPVAGRCPTPRTAQTKVGSAAPGAGGRAAAPALLEVGDLHVRFRSKRRSVFAVNGISYSLASNHTLAIVGESGSGKTVGARALMGLLPASAEVRGSVRFRGRELIGLSNQQIRQHRGSDLAMVFQDAARSLDPTMRVGAQITEGIRSHLRLGRKEAERRALDLLGLVRIPEPRRRFLEYPHQLSGGMRQRVMIAIALACDPAILIADEATTALDVTTQAQIMELLLDLQARLGMSIILISHDLGLAASYADEVLVMYAGRIVEQAPTEALFDNVRMPYTRVLLDAIPRIGRPSHTLLPVVDGRPPDLLRLPEGCAFSTRCPVALDRCQSERPTLEEHEPDHRWACWQTQAGAGHLPTDHGRG